MSLVSEDIAKSLNVALQQPLDSKTFFKTISEVKDLGVNSNKAFTYYEGMEIYVLETNTKYIWKEIQFGETGIMGQSYAYPPNTIQNGINYSGRYFNFVEVSGGGLQSLTGLLYFEPIVNIEVKEEEVPEQAMYFGTLDMGAGVVDAALIKNTFVSQSNFEILDNENVGTEIKMFNISNSQYLGHFTISNITFDGYRVLNVIEKGNWDVLADYDIQEVLINVLKPSVYSFELSGTFIIVKKGDKTVANLDLDALVIGGSSTITNISLNDSTGVVTFTFADTSTIDVDFSGVIQADSLLSKESTFPVISSDIYENLFVAKTATGNIGKGFYSADLTTNYTAANFPGFPYPANIDFIVCRYETKNYMLVKKSIFTGKRIFDNPNDVFAFSFFKYKDVTKRSMKKLGYLKVLSRKTDLPGLNANYWALPIWGNAGTSFPLSTSTTAFNELYLVEGVNEKEAYSMVSKVYEEKLSLKKTVTAPYTVKEEDNGLVLCVEAAGNASITVPPLPYGFECGLVQFASDTREISIVASGAANLLKPASKQAKLLEQYASAYIMCNDEFTRASSVVNETTSNSFILLGDLKPA